MIGILPTVSAAHLNADSFSANPRYELLNQQIFAARGEDLEITITGVERLSTLADTIAPEAACTSVQLHQQVAPEAFARYWNAAQAIAGDSGRDRRQLALLLRKGALARDADRALRAGDGHAARRTEESGRAPARVVRRALDHIDLRPVRGERPVLPRAPADLRGRGPARDARAGRRAPPGRAATAQRNHLPLEPAHLRRGAGPAARARGEPDPAGGADDGRHPRQRRLLLRPGPYDRGGGATPVVTDVVLGSGGELPRGRQRRHRSQRVLAERRRGARGGARAQTAVAARARPDSSGGGWTRWTSIGCSG